MITAFIISLCILLSTCINVKADIAATPATSIGISNNNSTYLKSVDVNLEVYSDVTICRGTYIIHNPSNITENLQVCFDPGHNAQNYTVYVNNVVWTTTRGSMISAYYDYLYDGVLFNLSVNPFTETSVVIDWTFSSTSGSGGIYSSVTRYEVNYLIIGTAGWNHTIDNVNVTFKLKSNHFKDYTSNCQPTSVEFNDGTELHFNYVNFSYEQLEISIDGDTITYNICLIGIVIWIVIIAVIWIIYIKLKKANNRKEI
jgi:hypothetical protein